MKTISTLISAIVLTCNLATAQDTMYVYRAGAVISKHAVAEIDSVIFYRALNPAAIFDIDGNVYHTVTIGTQIWMVENLRTSKYNDGTSIPLVSDGSTWSNLTSPGYCWYNNFTANKDIYGALYNWYTVNTSKLAPTGWHVSTDAEWATLTTYLINNGYGYGGSGNDIAKSMATKSGWNSYTTVGTVGNDQASNNSCGFAGLPGGYRGRDGTYGANGYSGYWWNSMKDNAGYTSYHYLYYGSNGVGSSNHSEQYGFSVRCIRDTVITIVIPTLSATVAPTNIKTTSAISGGNITSNGGSVITARGVCWSTSSNPTTSNNKTTDGTGLGGFSSNITGLTTNTLYYVRSYATNSLGTAYGKEVSFTTPDSAVTDIDGNEYGIVKIGTQTWMAENLKTTKYNDGTSIPLASDSTTWANLSTPGYCYYGNDTTNKNKYGILYNWYTVNTGKLAPTGWHVPTDAEWTTLENHLIANGYNYDGTTTGNKIAKSIAVTSDWLTSTDLGATGNDSTKNNTSGFAGLPGGYRYDTGQFNHVSYDCNWWSSTEYNTYAWYRYLTFTRSGVYRNSNIMKVGFSVRCLRDVNPPVLGTPTLSTTAAYNITATSATSGGIITNNGGSVITASGICWSTSSNPTTSNNKTTDGTGLGGFTSNITGLTTNTQYYVRSYATNSVGTSYGNEITLTTQSGVVGLTTASVSSIMANTATSGGTISSDGGAAVTARGVCWSTTSAPTVDNFKTTNESGTGTFTSSITGLTTGTTYHVRAYATNSVGTCYGVERSFTTQSGVVGLTTASASLITAYTATSGGTISYDGGAAVTARGICWNTTSAPTIANSKTANGSGIGSFTSSITGLTLRTTYYVRSYATNSVGTSYGNEVSFTTPDSAVTDIDGNEYGIVKIGTQTWMAENLKTTKYNDGTSIPLASDSTTWANLSTPGYCYYGNDTTNKNKYGILYNWYTVNTGKLAPNGWHVPTDAEWTTLENYLIANGYNYDGTTTDNKIAKSIAATSNWLTSTDSGATGNDSTKNNTSGFAGLPGGYRYDTGQFNHVSYDCNWWSSTEYNTYAWYRYLTFTRNGVYRNSNNKKIGFSVRCLRD